MYEVILLYPRVHQRKLRHDLAPKSNFCRHCVFTMFQSVCPISTLPESEVTIYDTTVINFNNLTSTWSSIFFVLSPIPDITRENSSRRKRVPSLSRRHLCLVLSFILSSLSCSLELFFFLTFKIAGGCTGRLWSFPGQTHYYARILDPSVLHFSLSSYRHPHICIPFNSGFVCCS